METARFAASDGLDIHYYVWLPNDNAVATIQLAHGMGEHAARYDEVALRLNREGYAVYANDHRGHGRTSTPELLGDLGPDGWNRVIQDALELGARVAEQHPGVPRVLFGHSMGAMITQQFIARHGATLDAAVISGSPGFNSAFQAWFAHTLARIECWRVGAQAVSERMQSALFDSANESFDAPDASGFEWLSRDAEEVNKYVHDELCGFVLRAGSLRDMFAGVREARRKRTIAAIPKNLPIYVFSGADDPVQARDEGLGNLLAKYGSQVDQLDYKLYPEGRHEMLNEINRDEVIDDLIGWLKRTVLA